MGILFFILGTYAVFKANSASMKAETSSVSSQNIAELKECVIFKLDSLERSYLFYDSINIEIIKEQKSSINNIENELMKINIKLNQITDSLNNYYSKNSDK